MVFSYWYVVLAIVGIIFVLRKDLRHEILWSGIFCLPILLIKPAISTDFTEVARHQGGIFIFLLNKAVVSFSFGALAAIAYEVALKKRLSTPKPTDPYLLGYMLFGIVVFIILFFIAKSSFALSAIAGLASNLLLLGLFRRDLILDALFSGLSMGVLYLLIYYDNFAKIPGDITDLWFATSRSNITIFSLPLEEIITVVLFGALWGQLYAAFKHIREK